MILARIVLIRVDGCDEALIFLKILIITDAEVDDAPPEARETTNSSQACFERCTNPLNIHHSLALNQADRREDSYFLRYNAVERWDFSLVYRKTLSKIEKAERAKVDEAS